MSQFVTNIFNIVQKLNGIALPILVALSALLAKASQYPALLAFLPPAWTAFLPELKAAIDFLIAHDGAVPPNTAEALTALHGIDTTGLTPTTPPA